MCSRRREVRFVVVAHFYADLIPGYGGPELSFAQQIGGITREWPAFYSTRAEAEAEACINRLVAHPDPSFCPSEAALRVIEIQI
jgi:hypothetical protein